MRPQVATAMCLLTLMLQVALPPLAAKTVASGGDGAGEFCFDRV